MNFIIERSTSATKDYYRAPQYNKDGQVHFGKKAKATEFTKEDAALALKALEAHSLNRQLNATYQLISL